MSSSPWHRYAAIGGSGMPADSGLSPCWTDRLAIILQGTARLTGSPFGYSNLGLREDAIARQTLEAIRLRADLASVVVGTATLIGANPLTLTSSVERAVSGLRNSGCDVLLATTFDPRITLPLGPLRERAAEFTASLWSVAREYGAFTMDLWTARGFDNASLWTVDRTVLTVAGHRLVAAHAARTLGIGYFERVDPAHDDRDGPIPTLAAFAATPRD